MPLVVLLRGVNVGGNKTFRPSVLAGELAGYDVVNVGAAGTFVVRKPGSQAKFVAELKRRLPVQSNIIACDAQDLLRVFHNDPFGVQASQADVVRFVSVFAKKTSVRPKLPLQLPSDGDWLVRVIAADGQFVFGEYRRHMKTIGYLGQLDKLFGDQATTRNWNTITAITRILTQTHK
jgi:uncharacterized protein (DUF1697 family)